MKNNLPNLEKYDFIEIIHIPRYTDTMEILENKIKNNEVEYKKYISQDRKDLLDYLEFLEEANKQKDKWNFAKAVHLYKRALWEKEFWSNY